jgi:hypothetical protein
MQSTSVLNSYLISVFLLITINSNVLTRNVSDNLFKRRVIREKIISKNKYMIDGHNSIITLTVAIFIYAQ